jgi:anti-sigma regulatory factor (Ser/Thr protein kinase)
MRATSVDLALLASSAARARVLVRDFLGPTADVALIEDAELVASELVSNAVRYAIPPIRLVLRLDDDLLRVEVQDGSRRLPRVRQVAPQAIAGRGLRLVGQLGESWGADERPRGKTVWCEVRTTSFARHA